MQTDIVVLAAGKGTRMQSNLAKVLHRLAGKPLINHVLDTARGLSPRNIAVVIGHQGSEVQAALKDLPQHPELVWVEQSQQLGTGHAVKLAKDQLPDDGAMLVLYGDVPLISHATILACEQAAKTGALGLVVAEFSDPAELGRIVRDSDGSITSIVEFKDADDQQRKIREINSGILAAPTQLMAQWLEQLQSNNAQQEYYLTDVIAMAVRDGINVVPISAASEAEVTGVNDRVQLAQLERQLQLKLSNELMLAGASFADPSRVDIRGQLTVGKDCFIDVNVVFEGIVELADDVSIGSGSVICDASIGSGTRVLPNTIVDGASVGAGCSLGPFARIRPGSVLDAGVKVGNFVETKKTYLGANSKASHLTYLGDAQIGSDVNIGAGTVTCNYDGVNKHATTIGDGVFVGTNSTLVAPIQIDQGAFVAAGSTLTKQVDANQLAVGRSRQRNIDGWSPPKKSDDQP
jgi:bifunctional UDP-N-acetylglucosamine pyrophosphorylase/glucosamine-1-phosphate N-acetyltransferase